MKSRIYALLIATAIFLSVFSFVGCKKGVPAIKLDGGKDKVLAVVADQEVTNGDIKAIVDAYWKSHYENRLTGDGKDAPDQDTIDQDQKRLIEYVLENKISTIKKQKFVEDADFDYNEEDFDKLTKLQLLKSQYNTLSEVFIDRIAEQTPISEEEWIDELKLEDKLTAYIYSRIVDAEALQGDEEEDPIVEDDSLSMMGAKANSGRIELPTEEQITEIFSKEKEQSFSRPRMLTVSRITVEYDDSGLTIAEDSEEAPKKTMDEALVLMDEIVADLAGGISFDKLAKKNSDSWDEEKGATLTEEFFPQNAYGLSGDDLDNVMALEVGAVSDIIEGGYNSYLSIYKVDAARESAELTYEDVEQIIRVGLTLQMNQSLQQEISGEMNVYEVVYMNKEEMPESIFEEEVSPVENGSAE